MGQTIKLAIADDHLLFRRGVISILNAFPDIELVAEASNGSELIEKIERAKQLPDVCLLDLRMPILDGYHTMPVLRSRWDIGVLVLSMHDHDFSVIQMLELGAKGFINKDCTPDMLHAAIRSVYDAGFYHSELSIGSLKKYRDKMTLLTEKEIIFIHYCCSELTYDAIAKKMTVSPRTVDGYRDALFHKLNVKTRTALALFAYKTGIVHPSGSKIAC